MAVQNSTMTEEERARMTGLPRALAGARDVLVGTLARPGTAVQDTLRVGATRLLGGDPATLAGGQDMYNQNAQQLVGRGLAAISGGVSDIVAPIQQAGLSALGAQQRQSVAVAPDTQPTPMATPAVAIQDNGSQAVPARTAADLAGINEGVNTQTPAQRPMERGNYNITNTPNVAAQGGVTSRLPQPVNIIEGGYGGFGGGRGTEYLNQMRTQDTAAAAQRKADQRQLSRDLERSRLEQVAAGRGGATERRAARQGLAALNAQEGLETQESGSTIRAGLQADAEMQRTALAGQVGLQQASLQAQGGIQQAEITGQYGLAGREVEAQASLAEAQAQSQSGANMQAQAEAIRRRRLQALAYNAEQAGDFAARDRYLDVSQPAAPRLTQDALNNVVAVDGRPVTAQEAQAYLQASGYYKTPAQ